MKKKYIHEYMWRTAVQWHSSFRIEDSEGDELMQWWVCCCRDEETLIKLWFTEVIEPYEHWAKRIIKNYCDLKCNEENVQLLVTDLKALFPETTKWTVSEWQIISRSNHENIKDNIRRFCDFHWLLK